MFKSHHTSSFLIFGVLLTACYGGGSGGENAGGARSVGSVVIRPEEASLSGCLNIELLLGRLKIFPDGTRGRIHSTEIQIRGADDARPAFLSLLPRSAYRFQQGDWTELRQTDLPAYLDSATQADCSAVLLYDRDSKKQEYRVTLSSASSLTLEQPSGNRLEIELLTPQSLKVRLIYSPLDPCTERNSSAVDTTMVVAWDSSDKGFPDEEKVSAKMLMRLNASLKEIPNEILKVLHGIPGADTDKPGDVSVPVSALAALRDAQVSPEYQACPPVSSVPPIPTPNP